jgi:hypothetical protein
LLARRHEAEAHQQADDAKFNSAHFSTI